VWSTGGARRLPPGPATHTVLVESQETPRNVFFVFFFLPRDVCKIYKQNLISKILVSKPSKNPCIFIIFCPVRETETILTDELKIQKYFEQN
jgi:hypothetical protein